VYSRTNGLDTSENPWYSLGFSSVYIVSYTHAKLLKFTSNERCVENWKILGDGPCSERSRVECMKSHTPECAKIEEFAATLVPIKTYHLCMQDFATKDYTLELQATTMTITQQQFEDGSWQEIIRRAFQ